MGAAYTKFNFKGFNVAASTHVKCMQFISQVMAHAGRNHGLCLSLCTSIGKHLTQDATIIIIIIINACVMALYSGLNENGWGL